MISTSLVFKGLATAQNRPHNPSRGMACLRFAFFAHVAVLILVNIVVWLIYAMLRHVPATNRICTMSMVLFTPNVRNPNHFRDGRFPKHSW